MRRWHCEPLARPGQGTQRYTKANPCSVRCSRKSLARLSPVASLRRNRHTVDSHRSRKCSPRRRYKAQHIARFRMRATFSKSSSLRAKRGSTPACRRRFPESISTHNQARTRGRRQHRGCPFGHVESRNKSLRGTGCMRPLAAPPEGTLVSGEGWCMRRIPGIPRGCCGRRSGTRAHSRSALRSRWSSGLRHCRSCKADSCSLRGKSERVRTSHRHCNRQTASRSGLPSPARSRRERTSQPGKRHRSFLRRRSAPLPPAGWSCTPGEPATCCCRKRAILPR